MTLLSPVGDGSKARVTWTNETVLVRPDYAVGVRVYRGAERGPAGPVVVHFHGGAFTAGSLDAGGTVSTLLAEAGAVVVSVDYPLAPQHPFPEALESGIAVLGGAERKAKWFAKRSPLYVAGEEAGGNLAAALALMARDQRSPKLAGQILLSPMLDPSLATCSMREGEAGPVGCAWADGWHQYLRSADKAAHPYASPIGASRLSDVAPALIVTAEDDVLRDESLRYARRLQDAGVEVQTHVLPAPTGWPCVLQQGPAGADWAGSLRARFATFLAATAKSPRLFHHRIQ